MKFTKEQIKRYMEISRINFGKEISYEEAERQLSDAVSFVISIKNIKKKYE